MMTDKGAKREKGRLPIGRNEDVEFHRELADKDDLEALERAAQSDQRAERRR